MLGDLYLGQDTIFGGQWGNPSHRPADTGCWSLAGIVDSQLQNGSGLQLLYLDHSAHAHKHFHTKWTLRSLSDFISGFLWRQKKCLPSDSHSRYTSVGKLYSWPMAEEVVWIWPINGLLMYFHWSVRICCQFSPAARLSTRQQMSTFIIYDQRGRSDSFPCATANELFINLGSSLFIRQDGGYIDKYTITRKVSTKWKKEACQFLGLP